LLHALGPEDLASDGGHRYYPAYSILEQLVIDTIERHAAPSENDVS
jgi:hypothetical protein